MACQPGGFTCHAPHLPPHLPPNRQHQYGQQPPSNQLRNQHHDSTSDDDAGSLGPTTPIIVRDARLAKLSPMTLDTRYPPHLTIRGQPRRPRFSVNEVDPAAFAEALLYATLPDFAALRSVRRLPPTTAAALDMVAPQPLAGAPYLTFFRWVPQPIRTLLPPTRAQRAAIAAGQSVPAMFRWRCLACSARTAGPRYCRECRKPMSEAALRLFAGQVRKDLTAEFVFAVLRLLVPTVDALHVESHTTGADHRGKGCAWIYLDSIRDAKLVLAALHRRVLADLDATGGEGFWASEEANAAELKILADALPTRERNPALPRLPIVVEVPAHSLLETRLGR